MINMKKLVSVIIPVYNDQEYLKSTLLSLQKQTYKNIEVIVVDDGSTKPVTLPKTTLQCSVVYKQNAGAPAARNTGQNTAKGEYYLFLDADVTLDKYMVEHLVTALTSDKKASFSYCNYYYGDILMKAKEFNYQSLKKNNYISSMSLVRAKHAKKWDESLKRFQDWDYWLALASKQKYGVWVPLALFSAIPKKHGISSWVPRYAFWWPFKHCKKYKDKVDAYNRARDIVLKKYI